MLDWDAPLSEQPESVKKALKPLFDMANRDGVHAAMMGESPFVDIGATTLAAMERGDIKTGADLVEYLGANADASNYLNALGIPGIRYFDATSRTAKEGTRNIVLFDDSLAKIISRK